MLDCLGDPSTRRVPQFECCDSCSPSALSLPAYKILAILDQQAVIRKKRRRAVRRVEKVILKEKLIIARDEFLERRSDFYMVGASFLCSDDVVDKLCDEAKYIGAIEDIPAELFGIWPDLKDMFFQIICENCTLTFRPRRWVS